jgi:hypothetical protein
VTIPVEGISPISIKVGCHCGHFVLAEAYSKWIKNLIPIKPTFICFQKENVRWYFVYVPHWL